MQGKHVVVAEDESLIALYIVEMLERLGCTVIGPVARVADVIRAAQEVTPVDCAVLDINLRGQTVFAALPSLLDRGVTVLLASGYSGNALMFPTEFRDLPCIVKPYDEDTLVRALKKAARDSPSH